MHREQLFCVLVGFLHALQTIELLLLEDCVGIRLHTSGQGEREQSFGILRVCFKALLRQNACSREGVTEVLHATGIWFAVDAVQKLLFIQEKITGQHPLAIHLFKKKRSAEGDFTQGFFRMIRMPIVECFASWLEFLLVELMEPGHEFGHRIERRRRRSCGRCGSRGRSHSCGLLRQAYCWCEEQNERQCASVVMHFSVPLKTGRVKTCVCRPSPFDTQDWRRARSLPRRFAER